ncbi:MULTISPECIES: phosphoadenosine phosphosulfate reductase domain-containing protein [Streptomyces]|uniref:Phosphoadenosine phosphosulfate reductase family protein n=1 Tax=Streptomyces galilaeus TaxID=33899 RepID=A0ABW9ILU7_STRGJ
MLKLPDQCPGWLPVGLRVVAERAQGQQHLVGWSIARRQQAPVDIDRSASNGKRHVTTWRPIHAWADAQVWREIAESGVPYHPAYDWGNMRLSCMFVFSGASATW